jgi:hypothetical protein
MGKSEILGYKPVTVPFGSSQITHGLNRGRNRVSTVREQQLTAWFPLNYVSKFSSYVTENTVRLHDKDR